MLYEKVSADMNFVEREKKTEKFWKENRIFEKSMENRDLPILFTMDRQRQMESLILDMCLRVSLKI